MKQNHPASVATLHEETVALPPDHDVHCTRVSQALLNTIGYRLITRSAKAKEVESCRGKKLSSPAPKAGEPTKPPNPWG